MGLLRVHLLSSRLLRIFRRFDRDNDRQRLARAVLHYLCKYTQSSTHIVSPFSIIQQQPRHLDVHQSFQPQRPANHLTRYTRSIRTGTSINGPTVLARASSLFAPKVATATAIASSKLLLAAVKL